MNANTHRPIPTPAGIVAALPPMTPFVGPEAIERQTGQAFSLRLGANESAFGVSAKAREAMAHAATQSAWYADPECFELRTRLAEELAVGTDNILVGSGIDGLLGLIVRGYCNPGDAVVVSDGTYPTFSYHVLGFGGTLHKVAYRDDAHDLDALAETARNHNARLVYLANPDNPSGTWHTADDIRAFIDRLPSESLLILDEAYAEFASDEVVPVIDADDPRLIRCRTFSKAHGMAGLRIGYAVAHTGVIAPLNRIRNQFEVNRIAQAGALASLGDPEFAQKVVTAIADGRRALVALANAYDCDTIRSTTNFVCIDVGGADWAQTIVRAMAARGVFIRMPGAAPLNRCIRVTIGTPEELSAFADVFGEILKTTRRPDRVGTA